MMKSFQPEADFVIEDLETLKAIVDPLRTQILELLVLEPLTVKQMAEKLGLAPSKLYYHVNMLEKYNFIQVVETRMVANMVQKYYRATAVIYRIADHLLSFQTDEGKDNINSIFLSVIDTTREDMIRTLAARAYEVTQGLETQPRPLIINRQVNLIPENRAEEFRSRLKELLNDFNAAVKEETAEPLETYAFTVAFYPSIYFPDEVSE
ncbi:MAG: helix-turn-helix domain-containing protein [Chloroflexi bacterium]|nr:helix-turn-helix domain-containing protein [Chloroflexota bacterium]